MNKYRLSKAGIDANEGIRRLNNNTEMYEMLLYSFLKDKNYDMMLEAINKKDVEKAFLYSHSLKGVAGNLSLVKLHADLIPLVEEFRAKSMSKADALLLPVAEDYERIIAVLSDGRN